MKPSSGARRVKLFHSIGFELLVYYLSVSIIVLALGSFLVYNSTISILQKRSENYMLEQFRQAEYDIQNLESEAGRLFRMFSIESDIQSYLQASNIDYSYNSVLMQQAVAKQIDDYVTNNQWINSIYIFTKGGTIGCGQNLRVVLPADSNHVFYTSGMFDAAMNAFPQPIWQAGITDKWFYNSASIGSGNDIVCFAKAAKPVQSAKLSAVIVFNINETKLRDTYFRFVTSESDSMYIIDSHGTIISGTRKGIIGKKAGFVPDSGEGLKSLRMDTGADRKLVVYYKLKDTGWYIVRETPLGIFQDDVIVLRNIVLFVVLSACCSS